MIPQHVLDVLNTLNISQKQKFQELCLWAGNSGIQGQKIPIDYDRLLEMVVRMGADPITPIAPPPVVDFELRDALKKNGAT